MTIKLLRHRRMPIGYEMTVEIKQSFEAEAVRALRSAMGSIGTVSLPDDHEDGDPISSVLVSLAFPLVPVGDDGEPIATLAAWEARQQEDAAALVRAKLDEAAVSVGGVDGEAVKGEGRKL